MTDPIPPLLAIAAAAAASALLLFGLLGRRRPPPAVAAVGDAAVTWRRRRVLNRSETLVLAAAEAVAARLDPTWRVWPQVALGEVLEASGPEAAGRAAFLRINAKRCDLLVVDGAGWPLAAIEYQGGGHHRGDWADRDAVKRLALGRAGVRLVEVPAPLAHRPEALRCLLAGALAPLALAPASPADDRRERPAAGVRSAPG